MGSCRKGQSRAVRGTNPTIRISPHALPWHIPPISITVSATCSSGARESPRFVWALESSTTISASPSRSVSDQNGSPGTATSLTNSSQAVLPRWQRLPSTRRRLLPASQALAPLPQAALGCRHFPVFFTPPTSATFPFTPVANTSNLGFAVDPGLRTPYSIHFNADIQRELPHHFVLDVGYVGTLGRRLLGKIDYAQYLDIKDTMGGQDMWTAYRQIAKIADITPRTTLRRPYRRRSANGLSRTWRDSQQIAPVSWFTNMLPNMPTFAAQWTCNPKPRTTQHVFRATNR